MNDSELREKLGLIANIAIVKFLNNKSKTGTLDSWVWKVKAPYVGSVHEKEFEELAGKESVVDLTPGEIQSIMADIKIALDPTIQFCVDYKDPGIFDTLINETKGDAIKGQIINNRLLVIGLTAAKEAYISLTNQSQFPSV